MTFQVLLSTMNKVDTKFLELLNIFNNCVVINQTKCDEDKLITLSNNIKFISTNEIGLSKSRNMAIKNSSSDICLLADDDVVYIDGYEEKILKEFEKNPEIDIICFSLKGINKKFKSYPIKERKLNFFTAMKVSSVEIAFRRNRIIDNKISFNNNFGTGSGKYKMGEENIFLSNCLSKKLKIKFVPTNIGSLYIGDSSWFNGYNKKYFYDRGAIFTAMNKKLSYILILQFALRKYKLYKNELSFKYAFIEMLKGKNDYKKYYL